ncbi:MAG: hypothetical protein H0X34_18160 [Chthoniobacterales bacterium]|nr:hypothetical protein [Chthoniobacterales bacterium]
MFGKPGVETLKRTFSERKWRVLGVLDLRHRGAPDPGEDRQFGAVELAVRKLRGQEKQCCNGRCAGESVVFCQLDAGVRNVV